MNWARLGIVAFILVTAIVVDVYVNVSHNAGADRFSFIGVVVRAILTTAPLRKLAWENCGSGIRSKRPWLLATPTLKCAWRSCRAANPASARRSRLPLAAIIGGEGL